MNRWALSLAVIIGLTVAFAAARPPAARPTAAAADVFSAERAMADVRIIAREPHPVGSPANARVRDHLLARLRGLGLQASVQRAVDRGQAVENVVGVLPGADRSAPAVLLMAHYDSVPRSAGAGDDAAGVSAILEAVRAFRARGAQGARDVVVLFTDGEEAGLHGARAWFGTPGNATRLGAVLNFEARGAAGRTYMFETGPNNAGFVRVFREAVSSPSASSLARFVYDRMPNFTDFTVAKGRGLPGLNLAFIGDEAAYHTPLATPERLDRRSLQHMGDQALALLTAFATASSLPAAKGDAVFADVFGLTLLAYPPAVGWGLLAVAAGLLIAAGRKAKRDSPLVRGLLAGVARLLLGGVLAGLLLHFARRMLASPEEGLHTPGLVAASGWLLAGAAAVLALAILIAWSGRPSRAEAVGALGLGLLGAAALQAIAPETAFALAWPVLLGAGLALLPGRGAAPAVAAVALGALGFAWVAGLLHLLFLSVGRLAPEALAVGAMLLPLVLHPLLRGGDQAAAARRGAALT